jgi:hypothetical protein
MWKRRASRKQMNLARDIQIQNQTGYQKVPAIDGQWQGAVKESHRAWDDETAGEQKKKLLRGPARDFLFQRKSPRNLSLRNYLHLGIPVVDVT